MNKEQEIKAEYYDPDEEISRYQGEYEESEM